MSQLTIFFGKTALAVVLTFLGVRYLSPMDHSSIISVAGVLSTVSGILFGFVLAAITIFTSADSSKGVLGALKKNNAIKRYNLRTNSYGSYLDRILRVPITSNVCPR